MRFIKPEAKAMFDKVNSTSSLEVYKKLEEIGRVCYKSEEKIDINSFLKFLAGLRDKKHHAMLEHHRFVIGMDRELYMNLRSNKSPFLSYTAVPIKDRYLVSGSYRGFNDWYNQLSEWWSDPFYGEKSEEFDPSYVGSICNFLSEDFDLLFNQNYSCRSDVGTFVLLSEADISDLTEWEKDEHQSITCFFVCDRGVTHEMVRHRFRTSFAQESTRYCNYLKGGFDGNVTLILPHWMSDDYIGSWEWKESDHSLISKEGKPNVAVESVEDCHYMRVQSIAEAGYFASTKQPKDYAILSDGTWIPQQTRSMLTNSLKAEIFVTATRGEWKTIMELRDNSAAHTQMQEIMKCARSSMIECGYVV